MCGVAARPIVRADTRPPPLVTQGDVGRDIEDTGAKLRDALQLLANPAARATVAVVAELFAPLRLVVKAAQVRTQVSVPAPAV